MSDIQAPAVIEDLRRLEPDPELVYGAPILCPELFDVPWMGTRGIHYGRLPQYRGKRITLWEMYHAESGAGDTLQRMNRGLDTGQIVKRGAVEIGSRSRNAVWRRLESLGLDLYIAAILAMRDGTADPRPQEGPKGRLFRDPPPRLVMALWWRQLRKTLLGTRSRRAPG